MTQNSTHATTIQNVKERSQCWRGPDSISLCSFSCTVAAPQKAKPAYNFVLSGAHVLSIRGPAFDSKTSRTVRTVAQCSVDVSVIRALSKCPSPVKCYQFKHLDHKMNKCPSRKLPFGIQKLRHLHWQHSVFAMEFCGRRKDGSYPPRYSNHC
jgi:hypothetical protein